MKAHLQIKQNVVLIANGWVLRMMEAACLVYGKYGETTCVVTSGIEGTQHSPNSSHYEGRAIDFRVPRYELAVVAEALRKELGENYIVLVEGNHLHVQVKRGVSPS